MAGPSFIQVHARKGHRDHASFAHHNHRHIHNYNRDNIVGSVVEVVETVSVIQFVDNNGQTISIQTVFPINISNNALWATASTPTSGLPILTTPTASPEPVPPTSATPTVASCTLLASCTSVASPITSATSIIPLSSSGTQIIPSISSQVSNTLQTLSPTASINTTSTTNLSLPLSAPTSSGSLLSPFTNNNTITSYNGASTFISTIIPAATSPLILSTNTAPGGIGATSTNNGVGTPSSTADAGGLNGTSNADSTTPTPVIVGSVMGSVAGFTLVVALLLFILRRRRQHRPDVSQRQRPADTARSIAGGSGPSDTGTMTQQSFPFTLPVALATLAGRKRHKPVSDSATMTGSSTAGSDRGFYRVSGRRIQSVLESGGDGYGGGPSDGLDQNTLSGPSFNRESAGLYAAPGPSFPPQPADTTHDKGTIPVTSTSPPRITATSQTPFSRSITPPPPLTSSRWSDGVGRSIASNDGSHTSRFIEEV